MRVDPRWADIVVGSKCGVGVQGETGLDRLKGIADPVLVLDESRAYYASALGDRMWMRVYHDSSNWKDPSLWAQHCAIQGAYAYDHGCRNLLFCNEQIGVEGLGQSEDDYRWLNEWGVTCTALLRDRLNRMGCNDMRLWGPALSPGHCEDDGFVGYRLLAPWLNMLDGISAHFYWRPDGGFIDHWESPWWAGRIEKAYAVVHDELGIDKPWAITEWNRKVNRENQSDILAYADQCKQYVWYLNSLPYVVAGFTFLYCRRDPGFADLTWADMPRMMDYMSEPWDRKAELPGYEHVPQPDPEMPPVQEPEGEAMTTIGNGYQVVDLRGKTTHSGEYPLRPLSGIRYLVVHHSGADVDSTAESMAQYHTNTLGWPGLAYSLVVHWDGTTEYTQDITRAGYTVASRNNECLSVCLPGNWSLRQPPAAQIAATNRLLAELQYQLGWFVPIRSHGEVALPGYETECCGSTWPQWKAKVITTAPLSPPVVTPPPTAHKFILGFGDLAQHLGAAVVGQPTEDEHSESMTVQRTSTGMMTWQPGQPAKFWREVS